MASGAPRTPRVPARRFASMFQSHGDARAESRSSGHRAPWTFSKPRAAAPCAILVGNTPELHTSSLLNPVALPKAPSPRIPSRFTTPNRSPLPQVNMQSEGRLVATPSGEKSVLTLGAEKGLGKSGLTVSIVVEPVDPSAAACVDDDPYTCKTPTPAEEDMVRSLIMNAELRKEEFAKLLEEHAQIVMEINKAENSLA
ncbi:hypothetical protein MTO96_014171 [Rhipicephalus appendiculatus]